MTKDSFWPSKKTCSHLKTLLQAMILEIGGALALYPGPALGTRLIPRPCPEYEATLGARLIPRPCPGYEANGTQSGPFLSELPPSLRASNMEEKHEMFWRQGDFGYVKDVVDSMMTLCKPQAKVNPLADIYVLKYDGHRIWKPSWSLCHSLFAADRISL